MQDPHAPMTRRADAVGSVVSPLLNIVDVVISGSARAAGAESKMLASGAVFDNAGSACAGDAAKGGCIGQRRLAITQHCICRDIGFCDSCAQNRRMH